MELLRENKKIVREYNYDTYEERDQHVSEMVNEGWDLVAKGGIWAEYSKNEF